jgi:short-subunit dehydrogenase
MVQKKIAFITGAAGGLGKAFAVECASRGWDMALVDQNRPALESLARGLRCGYDVQVWDFICDLTDPLQRNQMLERIQKEGLRFNLLINVAGVDYEGPFSNLTSDQIQKVLRLNIEATLEITHALLPLRNPADSFRIINVSSLAAFYPMPVKATYAASKRFLLDFSLALREELRPMGVTVTALCPAGMPTNAECIEAIEAQGWVGQLTTVDVGRVANQTLNAAMNGRAVVIPGAVNRVIQAVGSAIPPALIARLIVRRWSSVRQKRALDDSPLPA